MAMKPDSFFKVNPSDIPTMSTRHDVTRFASGDSVTTAELAPCCTRALRLDATVRDSVPHFMLMIDKVRERAKEFDVFHFHIDFFHFPLFRPLAAGL